MTKQKKLRYLEYYNLQEIFDKLYADSKIDKIFNNLMNLITDENNINLYIEILKETVEVIFRELIKSILKILKNLTPKNM